MEPVEKILKAVLYEGHLLYPYRTSALKNKYRWIFGTLYPRESMLRTECLAEATSSSLLQVQVRFLHLVSQTSEDVTEEQLILPETNLSGLLQQDVTKTIRTSEEEASLHVEIQLRAELVAADLFKISVEIRNVTQPDQSGSGEMINQALLSTNTILEIKSGKFISMIDPPEHLQEAAGRCANKGTWPVLVGDRAKRNMVLSSPIILYDYPQVAPESPGDMFDATEIDELLTLNIMTMTEEEKQQMRKGDERARQILERVESMPSEHLLKLHGTIRNLQPSDQYRIGERVQLCPTKTADIFDLALKGRVAIIESIEQDFEGKIHLAVVLEEDPGRDFGAQRFPGHRFFFSPDEVQRINPESDA